MQKQVTSTQSSFEHGPMSCPLANLLNLDPVASQPAQQSLPGCCPWKTPKTILPLPCFYSPLIAAVTSVKP